MFPGVTGSVLVVAPATVSLKNNTSPAVKPASVVKNPPLRSVKLSTSVTTLTIPTTSLVVALVAIVR